jgi:chorismate mutase / prephenate dehydratase
MAGSIRYLFRPLSARMMSSSAPLAVAPQPASAQEEPPPQDGWPGGLPALRAELDRIDNAVHDLLMQRALVVEQVAKSGKPAAFRPGREASIVRRLLARHTGPLPPQTLFRIWRELLAGTTAMQGGFQVAVCEPGTGGDMIQIAREHFGALTPLRAHGSPGQALGDVGNREAAVAVLPMPSESDSPHDAWWISLPHQEPRMHVIARLPFWTVRAEGAPTAQALVVAATPPDPSEHDRSLLTVELGADVSRARVARELTAAGLSPESMVLWRHPTGQSGYALAEIDGYVGEQDPRLNGLARRTVVLGAYAVPVAGGAA